MPRETQPLPHKEATTRHSQNQNGSGTNKSKKF
jgi:hypothetical protein